MTADYAGSTFMNLRAAGLAPPPPTPTTETAILGEESDGDAVRLRVRYANETETLELDTRWERIGPDWKIVEAQPVSSD